MQQFRYPALSLIGNYARALAGIVLTVVPLLLLKPISAIVYLLVFLLLLFVGYGIRTVIRQFTHFEVTDEGIRMIGPISRGIRWEELDGLSLKYFSTRRRDFGWMILRLNGGKVKLNIDSTISDFHELLRRSFRAAERNDVAVDDITLTNLSVLGIIPQASSAVPATAEGSPA